MSNRRKRKSALDKYMAELDAKYNVAKKARKAVRARTKKVSDAFNVEKKVKKAVKRQVRKTKTKVKRAAKRQTKRAVKSVVKKATASRRAYDRAPVKPQAMLDGMYANGWTARQIEVKFGISMSTQRRIADGKGKRPGQKHLKALRAIKNRKAPLNYSDSYPEGRRPRKSGVRELKNHIVINVMPGDDGAWVREATADAHRRGLGVVTKHWPAEDETPAREPEATEPAAADDDGDQAGEFEPPEPEAPAVDDGPDVVVAAEDDAEVEYDGDADVITEDDDADMWAEIEAAAEAEAMAEEDDYVITEDPAEIDGDAAGADEDGEYGNAVTRVSVA